LVKERNALDSAAITADRGPLPFSLLKDSKDIIKSGKIGFVSVARVEPSSAGFENASADEKKGEVGYFN